MGPRKNFLAILEEGLRARLPKTGDFRDCPNYRGIMLLSVPGEGLSGILLERMKTAADSKLRDHQAGFRQDRPCTDLITTLHITVEQSLDWNSSLYVSFIDYEKAFDSVGRETHWKLIGHYGIRRKIISIIQCSYQGMSRRVKHGGQFSYNCKIRTEASGVPPVDFPLHTCGRLDH